MTAVLAIEFPYHVLVIADSRVSWNPNTFRPQDNLQKIYPLGPTGIVGFSGSIPAAKAIFKLAADQSHKKTLPPTADQIPIDLSKIAQEAFSLLRDQHSKEIELMYVGPDYSKIGLIAENVIMAENIMTVMRSPRFDVQESPTVVRLGYAREYPLDQIRKNRDGLIRFGLTPNGVKFQMAIAANAFGPALARYAPHRVGGLFTVGVASARGVRWIPYGSEEEYQLLIEGGRFIQKDNKAGKTIPLETILEYNPYSRSSKDLRLDTPEL